MTTISLPLGGPPVGLAGDSSSERPSSQGSFLGGGINGHPNLQTDHLHQSLPQFPTSSPPNLAADRQHGDPILMFAEIPSDLARLDFNQQRLRGSKSSDHLNISASSFITPSKQSSSSSSTPIHLQPRKPSPGLAARLRALGFGTRSSSSSQQQPDSVGRLPEDQIRKLDHNHQAGSVVPVIERRGRPWKGAGAIVRLPSVASLRGRRNSDASPGTFLAVDSTASADATADPERRVDDNNNITPHPATPEYLPVIETAPPLEMDTNKYRLPDHTNGNGTKVQLDMRQQHLERANSSTNYPPYSFVEPSDIPPPPLPKDSPPPPPAPAQPPSQGHAYTSSSSSQTAFNPDAASYFNPLGLQRPGSIYTLSRVSFANQLAQLTSLQLPDAESLSSKVSAIPTAQAAARALIGAAEQIRNWISKASEVIDGLDSDDDVEWAAAGGREGLEEVEHAILRFEELINVYVGAIEELQNRPDIASVTPEDLQRAVVQMESIMEEWQRMRTSLHNVKAQVEIAMEWEELWGMVLGDIQNEMDELSRLVFEMEERRHKSIMAGSLGDGSGVDIGDLETIVEETQQQQQQIPPNSASTRVQTNTGNKRFSIPIFPTSPSSPEAGSTPPSISQDDSGLLALFARMQPLRASLDFLPMRLSVFETRASSCFPTACEELETRRTDLDETYKKLEKDAESLRKELGEDRWITVFRGAARQAQKMYESVERSVSKLREALDSGMHLTNPPLMSKKIESYETKKLHYGPAVERVLAIIDRGVKDRLTLNGEILRLHAELQSKWDELKDHMHEVDLGLEDIHDEKRNQQLRDSISSMLSNDRSTIGSAHDTPQSSPPSSVIMTSLGLENGGKRNGPVTPNAGNQSTPTNKRRSVVNSHLPQPSSRRSFSSSATQSRTPISRFSSTLGVSSPFSSPMREGSITPGSTRSVSHQPSVRDMRPRWNTSTTGIDTGHNFKPLTLTTPSPYAKTTPTRSPLSRAASLSPGPGDSPSHLPYRPRVSGQASANAFKGRRLSMQPPRSESAAAGARPASSMSTNRKSSLMPPMGRGRRDSSVSGRESPQAIAGARFAMRKKANEQKADDRPRWRV